MSSGKSSGASPRWTRRRRAVQLAMLLFFLLLPLTNRMGQHEVLGTLASLQLGPVSLVDPAAGFSSMLAAGQAHTSLLTGMILPLLLALALGPVFCSWVCPWGLLSELLDRRLRRRVRPLSRGLGRLRWTVLSAILLLSFGLGAPLAATLSAPRLLSQLPLEIIFLGGASSGTLALLGALLLLELVLPRRLWCRALCPVGSTLVLLRTPWTLTVGWSRSSCQAGTCGVPCFDRCPWNLDPRRMGLFDGCTNCAACVEHCPPEPGKAVGFTAGSRGDRTREELPLPPALAPSLPGRTGVPALPSLPGLPGPPPAGPARLPGREENQGNQGRGTSSDS